ncbi:hypothetical protein Tco_0801810 [Tanacetum coccineum]|uniref:Uncharacterized protein n=1 Tax=Tanacetum coccineum TaxID=301880 RepID=A0ABQ5A191_9ASTR
MKVSNTQLGEWKKGDRVTTPIEAPVLMISRRNGTPKRKSTEESTRELEKITFPPVSGNDKSSDPVIIKAKIFRRQVNRVYMNSGSLCEVIYEQCFLQLKPSIRSLRVDLKVLVIGFLREHSWPLGEILRRTTMQKIGIVVSTIHTAIKFYTPVGVGTVLSTYKPDKTGEGQKKLKEASQEVIKTHSPA